MHPTWIAERLDGEPAALAALVEGALPPELIEDRPARPAPTASLSAPLRAIVCRAVLGDLPDLPAEERTSSPPSTIDELAAWPAARLRALLRRLGLIVLAGRLARAPDLVRPMLGRLPEEDAAALQDELHRAPPQQLAAWAPPRPLEGGHPAHELIPRLGADLLGAAIGPARRRSIALLLPRWLGLALLDAEPQRIAPETLLALLVRADAASREDLVRP